MTEYKVVLIGNPYVGKTSLITSFQNGELTETPTIAASYIQFKFEFNGQEVFLNVWDTAGHEKFKCLVPLYARTADALLMVFDLSAPETFEGAKKWYVDLLEEIGDVYTVMLCGNKYDLAREADLSEYEKYAKENNMMFCATSAKTGENIDLLFRSIAEKLCGTSSAITQLKTNETPIEKKKEPKSCC